MVFNVVVNEIFCPADNDTVAIVEPDFLITNVNDPPDGGVPAEIKTDVIFIDVSGYHLKVPVPILTGPTKLSCFV
jgi:hypothetical protein